MDKNIHMICKRTEAKVRDESVPVKKFKKKQAVDNIMIAIYNLGLHRQK